MARTALHHRKPGARAPAFAGWAAPLLLLLAPAPAAANGHTGVATPRTAPELSDLALFVMAAAGIWFTRRALRARARKD